MFPCFHKLSLNNAHNCVHINHDQHFTRLQYECRLWTEWSTNTSRTSSPCQVYENDKTSKLKNMVGKRTPNNTKRKRMPNDLKSNDYDRIEIYMNMITKQIYIIWKQKNMNKLPPRSDIEWRHASWPNIDIESSPRQKNMRSVLLALVSGENPLFLTVNQWFL